MPETSLLTLAGLPRPEYAKQPEAILTDLLWRSPGSTLSGQRLKKRFVLQLTDPRKDVFETWGPALDAQQDIFSNHDAFSGNPYLSFLSSIRAPRARGEKSVAGVPIHPDLVMLQNLMGLVNKNNPSNLSEIVETIGWYGGASVRGEVANKFLTIALADPSKSGLIGLLNAAAPKLALAAWDSYAPDHDYKTVAPSSLGIDDQGALTNYRTPCKWFWSHWQTLCSKEWHDTLPVRRWTDWALCLLRSALGFTYLWQAAFFSTVLESMRDAASKRVEDGAARMKGFLEDGDYSIARVLSPRLPATQRNVAPAFRGILTSGEQARAVLSEASITVDESMDLQSALVALLRKIEKGHVSVPQAQPLSYSKNTYEFIRYTMLPRSSDSTDQSDFYYLARADSRSFWFEPGPEWLVVVASLCAKEPGKSCTLRELVDDLSLLGMRIDRATLVQFLERTGLTTDSPDADDALVVQAGF